MANRKKEARKVVRGMNVLVLSRDKSCHFTTTVYVKQHGSGKVVAKPGIRTADFSEAKAEARNRSMAPAVSHVVVSARCGDGGVIKTRCKRGVCLTGSVWAYPKGIRKSMGKR